MNSNNNKNDTRIVNRGFQAKEMGDNVCLTRELECFKLHESSKNPDR